MAISSSNIGTGNTVGKIGYNLWGSVWNPASNRKYTELFMTCNKTSPYKVSQLIGLSASFSLIIPSLSWSPGELGPKDITITANCAWSFTFSDPNNVFNTNQTASISFDSNTFGGNGIISIVRSVLLTGTATLDIIYSNGAGGSTAYGTIYCYGN